MHPVLADILSLGFTPGDMADAIARARVPAAPLAPVLTPPPRRPMTPSQARFIAGLPKKDAPC